MASRLPLPRYRVTGKPEHRFRASPSEAWRRATVRSRQRKCTPPARASAAGGGSSTDATAAGRPQPGAVGAVDDGAGLRTENSLHIRGPKSKPPAGRVWIRGRTGGETGVDVHGHRRRGWSMDRRFLGGMNQVAAGCGHAAVGQFAGGSTDLDRETPRRLGGTGSQLPQSRPARRQAEEGVAATTKAGSVADRNHRSRRQARSRRPVRQSRCSAKAEEAPVFQVTGEERGVVAADRNADRHRACHGS